MKNKRNNSKIKQTILLVSSHILSHLSCTVYCTVYPSNNRNISHCSEVFFDFSVLINEPVRFGADATVFVCLMGQHRPLHLLQPWHRPLHPLQPWHRPLHSLQPWHRLLHPSNRDIDRCIRSNRDIDRCIRSNRDIDHCKRDRLCLCYIYSYSISSRLKPSQAVSSLLALPYPGLWRGGRYRTAAGSYSRQKTINCLPFSNTFKTHQMKKKYSFFKSTVHQASIKGFCAF